MSAAKGRAAPSSSVYLATCGVFLGAGIVSLGQRLLSVGLPDLRGALGLGFDEAAWIPTAYDMAVMFMGPFTVFLGGFLGPRRVLLCAGAIFTLVSIVLPLAPGLRALLVLQIFAGLASGTFYPLALGFAFRSLPPRFTIYAIGAYSMELLSTMSFATPLEGWFVEHWSWRWIFWTSAVLTPLMMFCVWRAVPPAPRNEGPRVEVSWRGLLLASMGLSLAEGALEQGQRLDWFGSGTINAMLIAAVFLLVVAVAHRRWSPNPLLTPSVVMKRNTLLLGAGLFTLRFLLLSILVVLPGYLGTVQGYRPEQTGRVLLWLAIPAVVMGVGAAHLMRWLDGRLVEAVALVMVAVACLMDARLDSAWASDQFWWPQLVLASGLAFYFVAQIGLTVQQAFESGAAVNPVSSMTFAAFFQTVRLFGGQIGVALMQHFIFVRTAFHWSVLGRSVEAGRFVTEERLRSLASGLLPGSSGTGEAQRRAAAVVVGEVSRQAYTLAYRDGFIFIACVCVAMLVLIACLKPMKNVFDLRKPVVVMHQARSSG